MIEMISSLALFTIATCCTLGVFSPMYRENWLQFAGLVGLTFWSLGRLWDVMHGGYVSPTQLLAHVSMASYAAGTVYKFSSDPLYGGRPWWRSTITKTSERMRQ